MPGECVDAEAGDHDTTPGGVGLGALQPQFAPRPLEGLNYVEVTVLEVDVAPAEAQCFAATETEAHVQRPQSLPGGPLSRLEELAGFVGCQGLDVLLRRRGHHNQLRDIARHEVLSHRVLKGGPQDRVHLLDRGWTLPLT